MPSAWFTKGRRKEQEGAPIEWFLRPSFGPGPHFNRCCYLIYIHQIFTNKGVQIPLFLPPQGERTTPSLPLVLFSWQWTHGTPDTGCNSLTLLPKVENSSLCPKQGTNISSSPIRQTQHFIFSILASKMTASQHIGRLDNQKGFLFSKDSKMWESCTRLTHSTKYIDLFAVKIKPNKVPKSWATSGG